MSEKIYDLIIVGAGPLEKQLKKQEEGLYPY